MNEKNEKIENTKSNTTAKSTDPKDPKEQTVQIDWAEEASQELSDYIEEQGIYIRY